MIEWLYSDGNWFIILMVVVFGFMLWRYPTGVGGDPFPYETKKRLFPWEKEDKE